MSRGSDRTLVCPLGCVARDSTPQRFPDSRSLLSHLKATAIHKDELIRRGLDEGLRKCKASELSAFLAQALTPNPVDDTFALSDQSTPAIYNVDHLPPVNRIPGPQRARLHGQRLTPTISAYPSPMSTPGVETRSPQRNILSNVVKNLPTPEPTTFSVEDPSIIWNEAITTTSLTNPLQESSNYSQDQQYPPNLGVFVGGTGLITPPGFSYPPPQQQYVDSHMYRHENTNDTLSESTPMHTENAANELATQHLGGNWYRRPRAHRMNSGRFPEELTNPGRNLVYCREPYGMHCSCGFC
ncbi:hypothetical protein K440DRAFT_664537 [Wilcoxina mikolae CBS 423.85]|nr:hypothetical protein K440DRAFT_664537 [Wilcoxina mikolae CBS 423.85]